MSIRFICYWKIFRLCGKIRSDFQVFENPIEVSVQIWFNRCRRTVSIIVARKWFWCRLKALKTSFRSALRSFWYEHYRSHSYTQCEKRPKFIFVAPIQMASNFTYENLDYHTDGKMPICRVRLRKNVHCLIWWWLSNPSCFSSFYVWAPTIRNPKFILTGGSSQRSFFFLPKVLHLSSILKSTL